MNNCLCSRRIGWFRTLPLVIPLLLATLARADDGPFAVGFDGVNDYISVPHSIVLNGYGLTVTAWIKTSQSSGEAGLVNKYLAGSLNGWNLFLFNGEVRAWYFGSTTNFVWDGGRGLNGGFVANGAWHHLAFTVDFGGAALYVDGVLRSTNVWTGFPRSATTTQELRLGSYPGSGFYAGLIDEVAIWSTTLTPAEISLNRSNSLIGTERELRSYFRLTEGSGTFARNTAFAGFSLQGTLTNGPVWVPGIVLKPAVMTLLPDAVTSHSARLNGVASSGGTNTSVWFEWGITTNYSNATPPQLLTGGGNATNFERFITGLTPDVTHFFRGVASNGLGVAYGTNLGFTPLRLSLTQERESHTATLLPNGKVLVAGGYGVSINASGFPTNSAELFDPATGIWTPINPMLTPHGLHTATLLPNGKVLVVDAMGAELYDSTTGVWASAGTPQGFHNAHTATLLQDGRVLLAGGVGGASEIYNPANGTWSLTGPLNTRRDNHTATLLQNGKVLIAGGESLTNNLPTASAEVYDPATGVWTNTSPMNTAREVHTATLLINGQVLEVGGTDGTKYLNNSEKYNPVTGTWIRVGEPLVNARGYHTATLLPRGAVLVVGGYPEFPSTAEILEMNSDVWRLTTDPIVTRWNHTATLLPGGRVLLVGGDGQSSSPIARVELYEPHQGQWIAQPSMGVARAGHSSTLLPDGRVLVAGSGNSELLSIGWSNAAPMNTPRNGHTATLLRNGKVLATGGYGTNQLAVSSAELFDPTNRTWTTIAPMSTNRLGHTATLLPNGKVLVAGGGSGALGVSFASAELYDPAAGTWIPTGSLTTNRNGHTATLLPNGKVLVAGGNPDLFDTLDSAETYDLTTGSWGPVASMALARTAHRATLLHDGTVLVEGGVSGLVGIGQVSAEVFNPATDKWAFTGSMNGNRFLHSATLLLDGRVLVIGGGLSASLPNAEIYDPISRLWTYTTSKGTGTSAHAASLLPSGRVLVTGGSVNNGAAINSAEVFDPGLGFTPLWQPIITNRPSQLLPGTSFALSGIRFRGVSAASYGSAKDSPSDLPVVQLQSLESGLTLPLLSTNWSMNTYASLPTGALPTGWALSVLFVNGMPSLGQIIEILPAVPTPPVLVGANKPPGGSFQFGFTNSIGAIFGALATTNLSLPMSNWTALGMVSETTPGHYHFTDSQTNTRPQRFYRVRSF